MLMYQEKIRHILEKNKIIKTSDFSDNNIPKNYLSRLVLKGELIKVGRGIYIQDWSHYDEYKIFQFQHKVPIFSFLSALYLHGFTDIIPKYMEFTVYSGYNASRFDKNNQVHYVKKELFSLGMMRIETPFGNHVNCYNLERTICDLIGNRSKMERELFVSVMKEYVKSKDKDLNTLFKYAEIFGIEKEVQEILEVMLE